MKKPLALPPIDVWDPEFMRRALLRDRCSCAPDTIVTPWGRVYVGHLCLRHDKRYEWIWRQRGWWRRLRLKWMSDRELGAGIHEAFLREGLHTDAVPLAYREFVIMFNFPFRILKATWSAFWAAVVFRD